MNSSFKASKAISMVVVALLIFVSFTSINVNTTSVTNNNAPSAYKKQSDTNVLVMNFTITTQSDTKLAGIWPADGTVLEYSDQSNDWGSETAAGGDMWFYDAVEDLGPWNASEDCIFLDSSIDNDRYNNGETVIAGTAPASGTFGTGRGCKHPTAWKKVKAYDPADGGAWNAATDAIILEGSDNNSAVHDELNDVTFKLSGTGNASSSDIADLTLWMETAGGGFSSAQDTLLGNTSYSSGTSSWNITGLTQDINTSATFYVAVNISASAQHYKNIVMQIPTLNDANSDGYYNWSDQGLFLAGTNDTGPITNSNGILIDTFAPETSVDSISPYWNNTGSLDISATANDNLSGVDSVTLHYYNSSDNSTYTGPWSVGTDSSGPTYDWTFNFDNGSGWYKFYSIGTDTAGNVETAPNLNDTECAYDGTGPTVAISFPADGAHNGTNKPVNYINGTCNDIESEDTKSGVSTVNITIYNASSGYYWNDTDWASGKTWLSTTLSGSPYSSWSYDSSSVTWYNASSYIINASGTDNASNVGTEVKSTIFYDTYDPTVTITIPVHNGYYKSNSLNTISGECSDSYSGISNVNFTIYNCTSNKYWNGSGWADGKNWSQATLTSGYTAWQNDSSSVTWYNGTYYYVNVTAIDNSSNVATEVFSYFLYDTEDPYSNVNSISPYWYTDSSNPKTITYNADDNGSGLNNVTLYYKFSENNETWGGGWTKWVNSSNPDIDPWTTKTWDFDFPDNSGYYEFYTVATDNATNSEVAPGSNDTIIGYDVVDPTANIILPVNNEFYKSGSSIVTNITGNASDPQSISTVNLTIYNSTDGTYYTGSGWGAETNLSANMSGSGETIDWWYDNQSAFPNWANNKSYIINISAKDTAGNWNLTAATSTFTYDTTQPSAPIISIPVDGDWYNSLTNISGTASDDGGSKIETVNITIYNESSGNYWAGLAWGVETNLTANITGSSWTKNWYYEDSTAFPTFFNGTNYTINASATDYAGNIGSETSHTFSYDTNDLSSEVTDISTYWQTSSTVSITYVASDAGSGLNNVTLYYRYTNDNTSWVSSVWTKWSGANNPDTTPYSPVTWNFDFPSDAGYYQFYSIATDNASNEEIAPGSADAICGYDDTNPFVNITLPVNHTYYADVSSIEGNCSDSGYSGVKEVNITIYNTSSGKYWDNAAWADGKTWLTTSLSEGNTLWTYDSSSVTWQDAVSYLVNATTTDNASRTSTQKYINFTLDTTAPTVTVEMNKATYVIYGDTVRVFANFTEDGSGIDESTVELSIENSTGSSWLNSSESMEKDDNTHYYFDWHVQSGENCDVTVYVNASDNVSQSVSGTNSTKTIDNTAPVCEIQYNKTATYFKENDLLKVFANFTETGSGITEPVKISVAYNDGDSDITDQDMNKTNNLEWYYNLTMPANNNGTFTVTITATDNVSLSAKSNTNNDKKVDNSGPTATIDDISDYVTSLTEITGTSNDGSGVGINKTEVKIYNMTDNTNWTGTAWTDADNWNNATGYSTWTLDTSTITWVDGNQYKVYAKSTDNLTNVGSTVNDSFTFDEGDPLVTSVTITDTTISSTSYVKDTDTVNVTITYSDATLDSSSANSLFKADLSGLGGTTSDNASGHNDTHAWWERTVSGSGDYTVTVTINVTDDFGNYNNTGSDTIIADNTAPTLNYAVLDSDNDGTDHTYVDVHFNELYMDNSTIDYTDFNISLSNVNPAAIQSTSGNRTTIRFDTTFQTGDSPTIGIAGSIADLAGNTITSGTKIIKTFRISLSSGLNLISFPCDVSSETLTSVLAGLTGNWRIYRYNATIDDWQSYHSTQGYDDTSTDHWNLTGGEGYWLNVGTAQILEGNFDLFPDPGYSMPYHTLKGESWNLIGQWQTYNQSASTSYGGALASLSDSDVSSVWRYNVGGGYTNILISSQDMEPGKGYWLWKESSGDKTYTPS